MPFKSEAQRRYFGELVKQGKMSQKTFNAWNAATTGSLPQRVSPTAGVPRGPKVPSVKPIGALGNIRPIKAR